MLYYYFSLIILILMFSIFQSIFLNLFANLYISIYVLLSLFPFDFQNLLISLMLRDVNNPNSPLYSYLTNLLYSIFHIHKILVCSFQVFRNNILFPLGIFLTNVLFHCIFLICRLLFHHFLFWIISMKKFQLISCILLVYLNFGKILY